METFFPSFFPSFVVYFLTLLRLTHNKPLAVSFGEIILQCNIWVGGKRHGGEVVFVNLDVLFKSFGTSEFPFVVTGSKLASSEVVFDSFIWK